MSEPTFDGMTIREHASQVAESVRAINHLSIGRAGDESLPYPSDVAVVVAELARAAHGLRQATGQLAGRIERLEQAGHVLDAEPDPAHPDRAAMACGFLTTSVSAATGRLASALDRAHQHLSCLAYTDQAGPQSRTATPDVSPADVESVEFPGLGR